MTEIKISLEGEKKSLKEFTRRFGMQKKESANLKRRTIGIIKSREQKKKTMRKSE